MKRTWLALLLLIPSLGWTQTPTPTQIVYQIGGHMYYNANPGDTPTWVPWDGVVDVNTPVPTPTGSATPDLAKNSELANMHTDNNAYWNGLSGHFTNWFDMKTPAPVYNTEPVTVLGIYTPTNTPSSTPTGSATPTPTRTGVIVANPGDFPQGYPTVQLVAPSAPLTVVGLYSPTNTPSFTPTGSATPTPTNTGVIVSNFPAAATPDATKLANASYQLTQIAQVNLQLTAVNNHNVTVGLPVTVVGIYTPTFTFTNTPTGSATPTPTATGVIVSNASSFPIGYPTKQIVVPGAPTTLAGGSAAIGGVTVLNTVNANVVGSVPQAVAAITQLPTPVGAGTPVLPLADGSGRQYCSGMNGPRFIYTTYSAAISTTGPVTVATAAAGQYLDFDPSRLDNSSPSTITVTIKEGATVVHTATLFPYDHVYLPKLNGKTATASVWTLNASAAATQITWSGEYAYGYY